MHVACVLLIAFSLAISGCQPGESVDQSSEAKTNGKSKVASLKPPPKKKDEITLLCEALNIKKQKQRFRRGEDGQITEVRLQDTTVRDLSPLKDLPLTLLELNFSHVSDLKPIVGMPIEKLNLQGTPVSDISPIESLPLNTLWLNRTRVTDLSPLSGMKLESLDLTGTNVDNLSPLSEMTSLKRLNLSRCSKITDLTPLKGLQLERLTFNPETIREGLDVIRSMTSLRTLHVRFPNGKTYRPADFWQSFDDGALPRDSLKP